MPYGYVRAIHKDRPNKCPHGSQVDNFPENQKEVNESEAVMVNYRCRETLARQVNSTLGTVCVTCLGPCIRESREPSHRRSGGAATRKVVDGWTRQIRLRVKLGSRGTGSERRGVALGKSLFGQAARDISGGVQL